MRYSLNFGVDFASKTVQFIKQNSSNCLGL
jgi:hypothetical protein